MSEQANADEGIHVVIIGAGLAGLSAALSTKLANPAHRVTVLETVKELQEVGVSRFLVLFPVLLFFKRGYRHLSHTLPLPPSSNQPPILPLHKAGKRQN